MLSGLKIRIPLSRLPVNPHKKTTLPGNDIQIRLLGEDNPSVCFADSSPYTGEPFVFVPKASLV